MKAMEGLERAQSHRGGGGGGSEFFICFTARPSSSAAGGSSAMSASLSRRLRSSGSVKGGQSPMFPAAGGRRKGGGFEPAEPTSPKVTCIGQVRVKSKKKKGKGKGVVVARSRSGRGGEASFRIAAVGGGEGEKECVESRAHQSWVYSCFLPCAGRSQPAAAGVEKGKRSRVASSCTAALARWLMTIEEEGVEGERGEVVGLMVEERGKGDVGFLIRERERGEMGLLGLDDVALVAKGEKLAAPPEEQKVSDVGACIPPRNALLLMRCRSDPVRVAALADRLFGSPDAAKVPCHDAGEERRVVGDDKDEGEHFEEDQAVEASETADAVNEEEQPRGSISSHTPQLMSPSSEDGRETEELECQEEPAADEGEMEGRRPNVCSLSSKEERERRSDSCASSKTKEWGRRRSRCHREKETRRHSFSSKESRRHSFSAESEARRASFSVERWSFSLDKEELVLQDTAVAAAPATEAEGGSGEGDDAATVVAEVCEDAAENDDTKAKEEGQDRREKLKGELPDCLMMMMYEPKLSMEVSKETWVCTNDFVRQRPPPSAAKTDSAVTIVGDQAAAAETAALQPPPPLPPRPAPPLRPAAETAAPQPPPLPSPAIEQKKLIDFTAATPVAPSPCGPFVLTRCKSEPVRSSVQLAPDACFWKSRHQPIGAGTAEIGF